MNLFELTVFCNNKEIGTYKGDKNRIRKVIDSFGWSCSKKNTPEADLTKLAKTYMDHIPSVELNNEKITYFEYRIEKYKVNESKKKRIYSTKLPWIITRMNNGKLLLSNCITTESIQIERNVN